MNSLLSAGEIAHLHLLLNHFPTIGSICGLGLLLMAYLRQEDGLKKVSLEVFFLIGLATLPLYLTGHGADEALKNAAGVDHNAIAVHAAAALQSFLLIEITTFIAWVGLWQSRRVGTGRVPAIYFNAVLVMALISFAVVSRAANLGGDIRHPEIIAPGTPAPVPPTGLTTGLVQSFVLDHPWVWPTSETMHFLGMSLMFGVLFLCYLKLMGWLKSVPFEAVHRLLPFGQLGFGLNLVSGMFFFIAAPQQYVLNISFHWKVIFLALTGLSYHVLAVYDRLWDQQADGSVTGTQRFVGIFGLVSYLGVMYFGRMLPFIGNAF
jgi:hypothetical protein